MGERSVKPPKGKPKVQRKKEQHSTLFLVQNNPSNLTAKILSVFVFFCFNEKTNILSTILWVSIPICSKLPSRVRGLGIKYFHVGIFNRDGLWILASSVKRPLEGWVGIRVGLHYTGCGTNPQNMQCFAKSQNQRVLKFDGVILNS